MNIVLTKVCIPYVVWWLVIRLPTSHPAATLTLNNSAVEVCKPYPHVMPWFCTEGSKAGGCPATCSTGSDGWKRCHGHIIVGYDSNNTTTVDKQVTDMISRGFKGAILYWAGSTAASNSSTQQTSNETALKYKAEAESRGLDQDVPFTKVL